MRVGTAVLGYIAIATFGCGSNAVTTTQPSASSTPAAGSFSVVSSSPAFGSTVVGDNSDLQGTSGLTVTIQTSSSTSIPSAYFVLELLNGTTECLRTQIAYCPRPDGGVSGSYIAGVPVTNRCTFFVRDNQQPTCGRGFTTNRMRFILQARGTNETLFTQDTTGGWSFAFAR
jgi:hypothetical protein